MNTLLWLTALVALAANVYAVVALVHASRSREAAVLTRYALRCAGAAAMVVGVGVATTAATILLDDPHRVGEAANEGALRAERLARAISAVMNGVAIATLAALLPLIGAFVLHLRARRAGHE